MTCRWWMAALVLVLTLGHGVAAPIPVVKFEQPTMKFQASNPAKIVSFLELSMSNNGPQRIGGDDQGGPFNSTVKKMLGEKQLALLAKGKPLGGALYLREKAEETSVVVVLPFTSEKDGVAFLETCDFRVEADKTNGGMSYLVPAGKDASEMLRIRFNDDIAYIGINIKPEAFAANKLIPYSALVDEKSKADLSMQLTPGSVPANHIEYVTGQLGKAKQYFTQLATNAGLGAQGQFIADFGTGWMDWASRTSVALHSQAEVMTLTVNIDEKSLTNQWAMTVVPKAKSELAAVIGKHAKCEGRFHQLLTEKVVVGKSVSITALGKELAKPTMGIIFLQLDQGILQIPQPSVQNLVKLIRDQLSNQLATDKADFSVTVHEGSTKGEFAGLVALAVDDPANLEKTWKASVADWMKEESDRVKFDAEKIGEVNVHTITFKEVPKTAEDILGKEVVIRVGFGAKAMFVAVGNDGKKWIETAAALKAKLAPSASIEYHNGRLKTFAAKLGMPVDQLGELDRMFGKADGKLPFYELDVVSGETLVVTWKQNRMGLLQLFGGLWFLF
jgi:hypothetical protein